MLRHRVSTVIERNVEWTGSCATEPLECGWAREAVVFVRALKPASGTLPSASVEISPDGIRWAAEGTELELPTGVDAFTFARVRHFGGFLRIAAELGDARLAILVTVHLKG